MHQNGKQNTNNKNEVQPPLGAHFSQNNQSSLTTYSKGIYKMPPEDKHGKADIRNLIGQ